MTEGRTLPSEPVGTLNQLLSFTTQLPEAGQDQCVFDWSKAVLGAAVVNGLRHAYQHRSTNDEGPGQSVRVLRRCRSGQLTNSHEAVSSAIAASTSAHGRSRPGAASRGS